MKLMTVEVRGRQPSLRKAMQTKVPMQPLKMADRIRSLTADCCWYVQINLYRDELQGLIRDLERAQLMAREGKMASSTVNQVG